MIRFEWDNLKALKNVEKHGVSFEEAASVFYDDFAVQFYDTDHSYNLEKILTLQNSKNQ